MKILFISSSRKGKGISPFIDAQARSIIDNGVAVNTFQIEGAGLYAYLKSVPKIRKLSKSYDLLHAHYGFSGIVCRLANFRIPLVVSFLGDDLEGSLDKNGHYTFKGKVFVALNKFFAKYLFDFNIVKSESLSKKLLKVKNKAIIPNGIDFTKFYPIDQKEACKLLNLDHKKKHILFPSTPMRPVKNYDLFHKSIELLKDDVNELILENVPPDKVFLYYNAATVTVLTSFHEGSPNVIKEAIACNCSVVATPVGDVPELIEDIENCYISKLDPESIADKIKMVLKANQRFNTRKKILHLDDKIIANKIISLYKIMIDK